jgi:hypothetical protein
VLKSSSNVLPARLKLRNDQAMFSLLGSAGVVVVAGIDRNQQVRDLLPIERVPEEPLEDYSPTQKQSKRDCRLGIQIADFRRVNCVRVGATPSLQNFAPPRLTNWHVGQRMGAPMLGQCGLIAPKEHSDPWKSRAQESM